MMAVRRTLLVVFFVGAVWNALGMDSSCTDEVSALQVREAGEAAPRRSSVAGDPCAGLYGAEALTCAWGEDVKTCMDEACHGCSGTQCLSCKEDPAKIHKCCQDHWHSTTPPEICILPTTAEPTGAGPCAGLYGAEALTCVWGEDVKTCMDEACHGCSGTQCLSCKEDQAKIQKCCQDHWHSTAPPEICIPPTTVAPTTASPCAGLYGAEALTCAWGEDVKTCMVDSCHGCQGEQCTLCKEDAKRIEACCEKHWHSTAAPEMCEPFMDYR